MRRPDGVGPVCTRRAFLGGAARVAAGTVPLALAGVRVGAQTLTGPADEPLTGSLLVLLGTQGGPSVNLRRGQTASVVVVDDVPYMIDCGYGAVRALVESGIGYIDVANVFLTHLHDDHTLDVAPLLSLQWTGRRMQPTTVHGPHGTQALVEGALAFVEGNTEVRLVDEGRGVRPADLFSGRDLKATSAPAEAYEDERVRVTSIENTHFPEEAKEQMPYRSLAYRVDAADRSFVFSGDTAYSDNVVELARGADVFVCEAIDVAQHRRLVEQAREAAERGDPNADVLRHVVETHSTTEEVGRMAAEAGVGTVVLNHLVPGSNGPLERELPDTAYIAAVRRHFDGQVVVGRDQMRL